MYSILWTLLHMLIESPELECPSNTDLGISIQQPSLYFFKQFKVQLTSP